MILGSGLLTSGVPSFGTVAADSSDSALLAGQDALVCVYDGAAYIYFGKASGTWKTLWVDTTGALLRGDTGGTYAVTLASDGPAPFDAAYGFATDRKAGSVASGTTFTHAADFLLRFVITTLSTSGNINIDYRKSGTTFWRSIVTATAGECVLYEFPAVIQRGVSGPLVTSGDAVLVSGIGSTIKMYAGTTQAISYASASAGATNTQGAVGSLGTGVISDLTAWPLTVSGTAADVLDRVSA